MTDPLPLLNDLVRIPSVNPTDRPGTDRTGEQEIAEYLRDHLRRLGAATRLQRVAPGRPNVLGVFRPTGRVRRRLLLAPHTDTVSVAGMTIDPFAATVRGGKLWGRGASDTKGPMAAMLAALARLTADRAWRQSGCEVTFAGLMGEEAGNDGAKAWAAAGPRYDLVIAGEPTSMRVVHAHKGAVWLRFTATGKAGHASLAQPRDNALYRLRPLLEVFEKKLPVWLRRHRHPVLGLPTAAVTMLEAGSKVNICPDTATARADVRTVPGLRGRDLVRHLRSVLPPEIRTSILGESLPLHTDARHTLVATLAAATGGLDTAPWFCDAALFAARGMPAVALGPGSIAQAHTADEWIRIRDLRDGADGYLHALQRLAAAPS